MGSRLLHKEAAEYLLIAVAALSLSCIPPNKHLIFRDESGGTEKLVLRLEDGKIQLEIKSFSSLLPGAFFPSCNRYDLSLYITVKGPKKGPSVSIDPAAISVTAGDSTMSAHHNQPIPAIDTVENNRYFVRARFELRTDNWSTELFGNLPVRIAMDDFLQFDGEPVAIDTIVAMERQDCL